VPAEILLNRKSRERRQQRRNKLFPKYQLLPLSVPSQVPRHFHRCLKLSSFMASLLPVAPPFDCARYILALLSLLSLLLGGRGTISAPPLTSSRTAEHRPLAKPAMAYFDAGSDPFHAVPTSAVLQGIMPSSPAPSSFRSTRNQRVNCVPILPPCVCTASFISACCLRLWLIYPHVRSSG
jgi:hypothetical protein